MSAARTVLVLACAVLATACGQAGSPATQSAPHPTPTPLGGVAFAAPSFSTVVPTGWTNRIDDSAEVQRFGTSGDVEYLAEQPPQGQLPDGGGVTAVITVVLLSTPVPDGQLSTVLQNVGSSGATNLSLPLGVVVDGAPGQSITYDRDVQGVPGESHELMVNRSGNTFDIVLTTAQATYARQLPALDAVLAVWRWTG